MYRVTSCCMVLSQLEFQVRKKKDKKNTLQKTKKDEKKNTLQKNKKKRKNTQVAKKYVNYKLSLFQGMGEVASPKSLDGGEKINSILNFCDSPEGIYDAFINPKYKVGFCDICQN